MSLEVDALVYHQLPIFIFVFIDCFFLYSQYFSHLLRWYFSIKTKIFNVYIFFTVTSDMTNNDIKRQKKIKISKTKISHTLIWPAGPKMGNYRYNNYLEKCLSYGAEILNLYLYYRYALAVVESSWLDLAVWNYKIFILKHIVYS